MNLLLFEVMQFPLRGGLELSLDVGGYAQD
jgi:hypothetical protein